MTDQDQDEIEDPGKLGAAPPPADEADVEGHAHKAPRAVEDEDDVEGHFSSVRSTRSKGD
jgi:hypothetical protein